MTTFNLLFFVILIYCAPITFSITSTCRCTALDSCWPSSSEWAQLNASAGGALIKVLPPASPCHDPHFNTDACALAKVNSDSPFWRTDQPGAMQFSNLEANGDQQCLISSNRTTPCWQGSVPVYAVRVSSTYHIQSVVRFASQYNLRLVTKSTGHDYLGRSTAPGSLSIWTHHMKNITFHKSFAPEYCSQNVVTPGEAVTIAAGMQWEEVYQEVFRHNRSIIAGGGCPSVGAAGGYPQAAGHSRLSPLLGLGADNILQYEVVTADGKYSVVNDCQNKDLFWALRGGGGGTFGVVVSATYKVHPAIESLILAPYNFTTTDTTSFRKMVTRFTELNPMLSDAGWSGYFTLSRQSLVLTYLLVNKNTSFAEASLASLLEYAQQQPYIQVSGNLTSFSSYEEFRLNQCGGGSSCYNVHDLSTGIPAALASRLIPRETLEKLPAQLSETLISVTEQSKISPVLTGVLAGGEVARARDNAVNPAWRRALWFVIFATVWNENATQAEQNEATRKLTEVNKSLISLTPGSGTYMNEADFNEQDWQQSFFGEHYDRLYEIKQKVDPDGLFVCRHCVGSENWSSDLNCRVFY